MIPYPNISPEILRIGPFAIRWYGLMYAVGFVSSFILVKYQIKKQDGSPRGKGRGKEGIRTIPPEFLEPLYTSLVFGLIIGARLGYVLFYDLASYWKNPLEIFAVWHGGMSFHGGMIGTLIAGFLCSRRYKVDFWTVADLVVVTAPIGLAAGRLGNFINGELYGRVTDVPWAMVFPAGGPLPRHPSQLYEFFLEGVLLFTILWLAKDRKHTPGMMTALILVLYGLFRFIVEFFRQPDAQLGFVAGPFTMGQILSSLTTLMGIVLFLLRKRKGSQEESVTKKV
ncbi:MAG TPA: prolipoprotein diacylglyceryl transferase [Nitrospirota bacterium]|nr:prolipoprotein diacylglyceryl transferase [Nitrospirota bacterium]